MRFLLTFALLLLSVPQNTQPVDAVFERLAKVEVFAFGGIGYAGVVSKGETDYRTVLSRASASTDFEKLFAEGNLQAKCYALTGIYKLNPARFKELARPLRSSTDKVSTMHGCILSDEPLASIIKQIESGKFKH